MPERKESLRSVSSDWITIGLFFDWIIDNWTTIVATWETIEKATMAVVTFFS